MAKAEAETAVAKSWSGSRALVCMYLWSNGRSSDGQEWSLQLLACFSSKDVGQLVGIALCSCRSSVDCMQAMFSIFCTNEVAVVSGGSGVRPVRVHLMAWMGRSSSLRST